MGIIGKTLRFVGGLALGAGVGAAAAMLLAPQSGEMNKEQLQARVDEVLAAGRRASRARESELYAAWEAEMGDGTDDKPKRPASLGADEDEVAKQREKARAAASRAEEEAREKARKELEQAQDEAQKHLDKARSELEKAEKAEKA